ncbi:hypothetical protein EVAR_70672_1 [Eumeta japonica]|uniref:Uncharacterized protein n=1 Tax=Eumeta variegata TaxID=151549 RepID=A0A4C1SWW6_EUMVA|nr:hypothetical protein EVAR_70672_1 [Eumeta japonica]
MYKCSLVQEDFGRNPLPRPAHGTVSSRQQTAKIKEIVRKALRARFSDFDFCLPIPMTRVAEGFCKPVDSELVVPEVEATFIGGGIRFSRSSILSKHLAAAVP